MGKRDFRKDRKDLYSPKAGISEVDVPRMRFIAVAYKGSPDNERAQEAAEVLLNLSYAVKMSLMADGCDHEIMPLELVLGSEDAPYGSPDRDAWEWTMMIRQPDMLDRDLFRSLKTEAERYSPELDIGAAYLTDIEEGRSVQMLHAGSYSSVGESVAEMRAYMEDREYAARGPLRQIYAAGPGGVDESNQRTILRFPVIRLTAL